jgi:hypothetical protein
VDRNYTLENDLNDMQEKLAAVIAQNLLLQEQMAACTQEAWQTPVPELMLGSLDAVMMDNDNGLESLHGSGEPWPGGNNSGEKVDDLVGRVPSYGTHGSGTNNDSYYLCPGRMSESDHIYPIYVFDPKTQKQVLCAIWKSRLGTL